MQERINNPLSGYPVLLVLLAIIGGAIYAIINDLHPLFIGVCILLGLFTIKGFFLVYPNGSKVLTLFGKYVGTVKKNGFFWVNPLYVRQGISLRARNFESEKIKVNDFLGNPILISAILLVLLLIAFFQYLRNKTKLRHQQTEHAFRDFAKERVLLKEQISTVRFPAQECLVRPGEVVTEFLNLFGTA